MTQNADRLTRRKIPAALRAIEHSKIPAWILSLVLHTIILLTLAVLWTSSPKGTSSVRGGQVGIAVVVSQSGHDAYYLAGTASSDQASMNSDAQASLPAPGGSSEAHAEILRGLLPALDAGAGSNAATGDVGLAGGNSSLKSGSGHTTVKTEVFGIEGEGSRFVYVFDRSDSMNSPEGKPLQRAKDELLTSLKSLGPIHQFQIVFYNDHPLPFGGTNRPKLLRGEEQLKELAQRFVREMKGQGGTNHLDALSMALDMNPDVLFFLTDADDNPGFQKIQRVIDRAERIGTTIHCVQFGNGGRTFGSNWINQLADTTRGRFKYINVNEL
jgi:hypothetical protein